MRKKGEAIRSDARVLGSSSFVDLILSEAEKKELEMLRLHTCKSDLPTLLDKISKNEQIRYNELIKPILAIQAAKKVINSESGLNSNRFMKTLRVNIGQCDSKQVAIRINSKEVIPLSPVINGVVEIPIEERLRKINPVIYFPCDQVFYTGGLN